MRTRTRQPPAERGPDRYGGKVIDWRRSRLAAAIVIAFFFAVQLAIPIGRLDGESQRFGWQMFSSASLRGHFVVTTADGQMDIDVEDYVAAVRAEVDVDRLLPVHLCSTIPGAEIVTWDNGSHEC